MKSVLRLLTLPIRLVLTVFIWGCALLIKLSGKLLGWIAGILLLMALVVSTYSVKNALILFALAFLVSPIGLPMIAVGLLSVLSAIRNTLASV